MCNTVYAKTIYTLPLPVALFCPRCFSFLFQYSKFLQDRYHMSNPVSKVYWMDRIDACFVDFHFFRTFLNYTAVDGYKLKKDGPS